MTISNSLPKVLCFLTMQYHLYMTLSYHDALSQSCSTKQQSITQSDLLQTPDRRHNASSNAAVSRPSHCSSTAVRSGKIPQAEKILRQTAPPSKFGKGSRLNSPIPRCSIPAEISALQRKSTLPISTLTHGPASEIRISCQYAQQAASGTINAPAPQRENE